AARLGGAEPGDRLGARASGGVARDGASRARPRGRGVLAPAHDSRDRVSVRAAARKPAAPQAHRGIHPIFVEGIGGPVNAMGRAHLKTGLALVLGVTRTDRLIRLMSGTRRLPLVVGYHRVVDDGRQRRASIIAPMLVSRRMFERQLDWIGRRFRFVSLDELGARLESGNPFEMPTATITFDDGYRDMYEHAYPVLKRKGIPAAVFVVTDWIDRATPLYHDRLYLLLTRDWSAAREVLVELGVMTAERALTSRTFSEPFGALRFLLTTLCQEELARVLAALEERLSIDTDRLDGLKPLTWAMLAEMQRGGITVGSHTRTHALLTRESPSRMLEETIGARQALEERLGVPIDHFAYPDGAFNTETVEAVAR